MKFSTKNSIITAAPNEYKIKYNVTYYLQSFVLVMALCEQTLRLY